MTYRAKEHYRDGDVASAYDAERFANRKGRLVDRREQALISAALRQAGVAPPARLADIPCGTGRLTATLARAGFEVAGVDVSEAMIAQAVQRCDDLPAALRPTFVTGDAEAMPFGDRSFDVVVSLRLFGHLPPASRARALSEFRRISRRHVVVAYYLRGSLQNLLRRSRRRELSWHPTTLTEIDKELATAGLRRVGRHFMLPLVSETVVVLAEAA